MGSNKTYQQKGDRGRMLGESDEFRHLRHAVEKVAGDRERHPQRLPPLRREPARRTGRRSKRSLRRCSRVSGSKRWRFTGSSSGHADLHHPAMLFQRVAPGSHNDQDGELRAAGH